MTEKFVLLFIPGLQDVTAENPVPRMHYLVSTGETYSEAFEKAEEWVGNHPEETIREGEIISLEGEDVQVELPDEALDQGVFLFPISTREM